MSIRNRGDTCKPEFNAGSSSLPASVSDEFEVVADQKIKLPVETPLEQMFKLGVIAGLAFIIVSFMWSGDEWFIIGAVCGIALSLLCLALLNYSEGFYAIDPAAKKLLYCLSIAGLTWERLTADFEEISTITTTSIRKYTKRKYGPREEWREYAMVVILRDGQIVRISDFIENGFRDCSLKAELLSRLMGVGCLPGHKRGVADVRKNAATGRLEILQHEEFSHLSEHVLMLVIALIFAVMAIFAR